MENVSELSKPSSHIALTFTHFYLVIYSTIADGIHKSFNNVQQTSPFFCRIRRTAAISAGNFTSIDDLIPYMEELCPDKSLVFLNDRYYYKFYWYTIVKPIRLCPGKEFKMKGSFRYPSSQPDVVPFSAVFLPINRFFNGAIIQKTGADFIDWFSTQTSRNTPNTTWSKRLETLPKEIYSLPIVQKRKHKKSVIGDGFHFKFFVPKFDLSEKYGAKWKAFSKPKDALSESKSSADSVLVNVADDTIDAEETMTIPESPRKKFRNVFREYHRRREEYVPLHPYLTVDAKDFRLPNFTDFPSGANQLFDAYIIFGNNKTGELVGYNRIQHGIELTNLGFIFEDCAWREVVSDEPEEIKDRVREEDCPICWEGMNGQKKGDGPTVITRCGHIYHEKCLQHASLFQAVPSCPTCRTKFAIS